MNCCRFKFGKRDWKEMSEENCQVKKIQLLRKNLPPYYSHHKVYWYLMKCSYLNHFKLRRQRITICCLKHWSNNIIRCKFKSHLNLQISCCCLQFQITRIQILHNVFEWNWKNQHPNSFLDTGMSRIKPAWGKYFIN